MCASAEGHIVVVQQLLSGGALIDLQDEVRHILVLLTAIGH